MIRLTTFAAVPLLAACAATMPPQDIDLPGVPAPGGECNASGVQDRIGQRATEQLGAELLKLTGARTLRWGPPDTAFTMDFRQDRLNIHYDRDYIITRINCG